MKNLSALLMILGASTLLGWSQFSYADWGGQNWGHHGTHQYYRYHDHPHFGLHIRTFYPDEYFSVWAGGTRYYYDDGVYYNYVGGDYVVVNPPAGAVVGTIPSDFQPMVINGVTYYTDSGIYYVKTPSGYKVVAQPLQAAVSTQSVFTVNVPNNGGGYTTITLKRSGNGFVGPQGEFYAAFPQVSQLRSMYAR